MSAGALDKLRYVHDVIGAQRPAKGAQQPQDSRRAASTAAEAKMAR